MVSEGAARAKGDGAGFRGPLLVDAHVHFYDCYDQTVFFERALENFRAAAAALGLAPGLAGCMLFSESAGHHYFRRFQADAGCGNRGPWKFRRTDESCSLTAVRDSEEEILLIAGRQIATAERLEVLSLGCDRDFPDGLAIGPTLDAVLESGALAVLPWGFSKWWFGRGALMRELVSSIDPARVCLGDNSGRPRLIPGPRLFRLAQARNIRILPGTDPLPFPSEAAKVGRFGFLLEGEVDRRRPAASVKTLTREQAAQPVVYGRLEAPGRFCRNQVMMQVRKRA